VQKQGMANMSTSSVVRNLRKASKLKSDPARLCRMWMTSVHTWNVCTDVPCSGEGETRCKLYPCVNALYPHKTEVLRVMWLQDADEVTEGVFAHEDIEAGSLLLDFCELRLATAIESSGQWCGWRLRFDIESKLSNVTNTFVVKDTN
jgi:hypothetical protein